MPRVHPATIRVVSAVCGCCFSLITLVAAVALFAVPSLTPVGPVVTGVISASTLSLPIWAVGLLYSLPTGSLGFSRQRKQILVAVAGGTLGLHLTGFVAVLSQTEPLRTIGDGAYLLATILLFILSGTTLFVGSQNTSASNGPIQPGREH